MVWMARIGSVGVVVVCLCPGGAAATQWECRGEKQLCPHGGGPCEVSPPSGRIYLYAPGRLEILDTHAGISLTQELTDPTELGRLGPTLTTWQLTGGPGITFAFLEGEPNRSVPSMFIFRDEAGTKIWHEAGTCVLQARK